MMHVTAVTDFLLRTLTVKSFLTMHTRIAIPETILGNRFSGGKCGSKSPVTGFLSTAGANAAKVGRGLS